MRELLSYLLWRLGESRRGALHAQSCHAATRREAPRGRLRTKTGHFRTASLIEKPPSPGSTRPTAEPGNPPARPKRAPASSQLILPERLSVGLMPIRRRVMRSIVSVKLCTNLDRAPERVYRSPATNAHRHVHPHIGPSHVHSRALSWGVMPWHATRSQRPAHV